MVCKVVAEVRKDGKTVTRTRTVSVSNITDEDGTPMQKAIRRAADWMRDAGWQWVALKSVETVQP